MLNGLWERETEVLCTVLVSWRKEIGLESSVCMGMRANSESCNSLESTGAVGSAACSMGEQGAKSISCRIKSWSFISLPVCWDEQHSDQCAGFWGWALRPIEFPEESNKEVTEDKCQKFFRMTSFVLKSGRVLLCYTNQQLLSSVLQNLSQSCSRQHYLIWASCAFSVRGCRSCTLGRAGAVLPVQHYWKGVWRRMLAVFVERVCLVGFFSFLFPVRWDSWGSDIQEQQHERNTAGHHLDLNRLKLKNIWISYSRYSHLDC